MSFPGLHAHSSVVASESGELQPPLLVVASLQSSRGPEEAEAPQEGPASPGGCGRGRGCGSGLSLLGEPPASTTRKREGQTHRTGAGVEEDLSGAWLGYKCHPAGTAVPGCQCWRFTDGFGEGAASGFERQPGRGRGQATPAQPFLGNRPQEGARLSGGCCGPARCSVYVRVKPYVTIIGSLLWGLLFLYIFVLIVKPSPVFKVRGCRGKAGERGIPVCNRYPLLPLFCNKFK